MMAIGKVQPDLRQVQALERAQTISRRQQALLAAAGEDGTGKRWHVLTVHAGCDNAVDNALANARIERWMASREIKAKRRSHRKHQNWNAFVAPALPGYLFIRVAWTPALCGGLKMVDGVAGMLGGWERPAPLSDKAIERVRVRVERDPEFIAVLLNALQVGDPVMIEEGPFASYRGEVVEVDETGGRVKADVYIFGRATPVDLEVAQVSKIE